MGDFVRQLLQSLQEFLRHPIAQADDAMGVFVSAVQWSAIVLSALAGAYSARRHGMDFYGTVVIAFISAVGGGTVRDLLLGRYPIFWLVEPIYALSVLVIVFLSNFINSEAQLSKTAAKVVIPVRRLTDDTSPLFLTVDALALGLWAYLGTTYALRSGVPSVLAPILGVITASFGAIIRDVFFARVPEMFMPGQLYALAAAVGAVAYVLLQWMGFGMRMPFLACFALTFAVRMLSIKYNIQSH